MELREKICMFYIQSPQAYNISCGRFSAWEQSEKGYSRCPNYSWDHLSDGGGENLTALLTSIKIHQKCDLQVVICEAEAAIENNVLLLRNQQKLGTILFQPDYSIHLKFNHGANVSLYHSLVSCGFSAAQSIMKTSQTVGGKFMFTSSKFSGHEGLCHPPFCLSQWPKIFTY